MNKTMIAALAGAVLLLLAQLAHADEYAAAFKARRYQDVERQANAALAVDAVDPHALAAKVDALLSMKPGLRLAEAQKLAEQCIAAHPKESICHEALGNVLGTKAIDAGIFSAMGYAGKIRDAFRTAVELDPNNLSARFSLQQYYLSAPGIVGGGTDKAETLAAATGKISPAAASVMLAMIAVNGEQARKAEAIMAALAPPDTDALADQQRDTWSSIGQLDLQTKKFGDAERVFRTLQTRFPDSELGPYGLGRVLQEQGQFRAALALFDKAAALTPRAVVYYRMAQSLQAVQANAQASSAYAKALGIHPPLSKKQHDDALKQLALIKG